MAEKFELNQNQENGLVTILVFLLIRIQKLTLSLILLVGTTTYALGKVFEQHFTRSGTLDNFDVEEMKESFKDLLKKAKVWRRR